MLTKKDFKKVAEILNKNLFYNGNNEFNEFLFEDKILSDFVKWFKTENPRFNEVKFREAILKENETRNKF